MSYAITYMWNLKKLLQMDSFTKQKNTHRHRKGTYGYKVRTGGVCVLRGSVVSDSQAPQSMGLPRLEYWSGAPFPTPGDLPDTSLASQVLLL